MNFKNAVVKYNSGCGALLCSNCRVILLEGFYTPIRGSNKKPLMPEDKEHYCTKCKER